MDTEQIVVSVLMSAINYIIVNAISSAQQKATVADIKAVLTILRNDSLSQTKENHDYTMAQVKESAQHLMDEIKEIKSQIAVMQKAPIK